MEESYIRVYDNVINKDLCDKLISKFEKETRHYEDMSFIDHRSFMQINLHQHEEWRKFRENLQPIFLEQIERYKKDCNITKWMFPDEFGLEHFRMKRYLPNNIDQFNDHVDVHDYMSARRFLVFFLYLNDNDGGETELLNQKISVKPKAGSLLLFPPLWTYPHAGRKAINRPKYIIGSYLHYV